MAESVALLTSSSEPTDATPPGSKGHPPSMGSNFLGQGTLAVAESTIQEFGHEGGYTERRHSIASRSRWNSWRKPTFYPITDYFPCRWLSDKLLRVLGHELQLGTVGRHLFLSARTTDTHRVYDISGVRAPPPR
jgi:hypothetical protein